jgi:hypothetical protein
MKLLQHFRKKGPEITDVVGITNDTSAGTVAAIITVRYLVAGSDALSEPQLQGCQVLVKNEISHRACESHGLGIL